MGRRARLKSKVLVKTAELRLVLVAMPAGSIWPEHRAAGRVAVHVLAGRIAFGLGETVRDIGPGELVAIEEGFPHDIRGQEDTAFLLIVAGPESAATA